MKILFVCLGNICRSPAAEGVFRSKVVNAGLVDKVECASVGTGSYNLGCPPDSRMVAAAKSRGYVLEGEARRISFPEDFMEFDLILTMDNSNFNNVRNLDQNGKYHHKVKKFTDFCSTKEFSEVPDPYYDGDERFNLVLDILDDGTEGLLRFVSDNL
jgi:protein-tyrosine phosphatase